MSDRIINMQSLHDDDHRAVPLIIKTRHCGCPQPVVDALAPDLRIGILGLERVIDDEDICAPTGQCAANRGGKARAVLLQNQLLPGILEWRQSGLREEGMEPVAFYHATELIMELGRQILRVTGADDATCRVMPKKEGRKSNRGNHRLETARRQRDDEALGLPIQTRSKACAMAAICQLSSIIRPGLM